MVKLFFFSKGIVNIYLYIYIEKSNDNGNILTSIFLNENKIFR
jgi:hypothetical protein